MMTLLDTERPPLDREQKASLARKRRAGRVADAASAGVRMILLKIVLLGLIDAIAVYAAALLYLREDWLVLGAVVVVTLIVNVIYFSRRFLPAKYLTPGLIFLLIFQIFVVGYTGYIAFTNYGSGHNSTKADAISSLILSAQQRVPDSPVYELTVLEQLGEFSLLVTDPDGDVSIGSADSPLQSANNAETDDSGKAVALDGYTALDFSEIVANQEAIAALAAPLTDDPNDGALRTPDGSNAYLYLSTLLYDEAADTMTNTTTGVVYADDGSTGSFVAGNGEELRPGWKIEVGFANFASAFGDESIRGPLLGVTIWTFVFAFLSVLTTFGLGLFLAIVFNDMRMRGRNVYRVIMILPYAFPAFLSALVWAGMLNPQFGFINQVLFGGADIPWLTNEWLAKFSILLVNLWLGFPYMFLVTTGALQSIPAEIEEAATVDGARPWQVFRLIKLPLLLVSVAPLLIASFAFNFNNFNLIYMLTNGGPRYFDAGVNVGATDILISLVYKVAFVGADRDYGLASAFSILIFVLVATVSIISFKQTKALEELN